MRKPLRVLIVEDSVDDAELVLRELRLGGYDPAYERVETAKAMKAALEMQEWDIVIADYALPSFNAMEALSLLQSSGLDLPFIIVSGTIGEEVAVSSMKAGAHDYVMKDNQARLVASIDRLLKEADERRKRKQAEEEVDLLLSLTMAIAETESFSSALSIVLRKVCETTGWIYGEAWLPSPDGKRLECSQVWHGNSEELKGFEKKSKEFTFSPGVGLPGRVWSSKKPEWNQDATVNGELLRAKFTKESGFKAAMGIPVLAKDKVVAVLVFLVKEQRVADERLIKIVSAVAVQLGLLMQRKRAEEALRESEEKLKSILDNAAAMIYVKDLQGRHTFINNQFEKLIYQKRHLKRDEVMGKTDYELWPKQLADSFRANDQKVTETGKSFEFDETITLDDGTHSYLTIKFPLRDSSGAVCAVCGISTDITERKLMIVEREKLNEQLHHAKRLESVGKLAGAIAHDFNNILSGVVGYGELLLNKMKKDNSKDDTSKDYVQRLLATAERAVNLIQGLLTFSKKQVTDLKPVNLNGLIKKAENILSGLIPGNIKLKITFTGKDCVVMADSGQIERALMNLAVNAKDAMPDGGLISIGTDVVKIDNEFIKTWGYGEIGQYARISFSDTGVGMDEETQEKIFEPFFTTKKSGKGTGLGLSIVYAIVKQHGGYINVFSELGKGTRFEIYLPVIESAVEEVRPKDVPTPAGGTETILLAEDDDDVRNLSKTVLEGVGYRVIDAVDGEEAMNKFMKNKDKIKLLVLDVMMPKKNGKEVYDEICKTMPDIKALFISGYAEDVIDKRVVLHEKLHFLSKPVLPTVLLRNVRELLDASQLTTSH